MRHVFRSIALIAAVGIVPAFIMPATPAEAASPAWEAQWDAAWARATTYYRIRPASTLASDPACRDLNFQVNIKNLTSAIASRHYGDATRLLSEVQDKSMCLDLEGARGLEFALAGFVHRAMTKLPAGSDQDAAVHGALNAGSLLFDQLQYTRRSWWLPMMKYHADRLAPVISRYPKNELPFYVYDYSRNALARGVDPMLLAQAMRNFGNFADGTCSLLEMANVGYKCKGWVGKGGLSGGKGGAGADGGLPSIPTGNASIACITSAAMSTGPRGQLGCAAKAVSGMTFDPHTSPQSLLSQGITGGGPGIRDPQCARSQDAGNAGGQTEPEAAKKEPSTWDKIKDAASKAVGVAVDVVVSVFDKTPPVVSDLKPLASPEGADAARGALQMLQANAARDALLTDDGIDKYNQARDGRVTTDPQANNNRTIDGLGPLGGGPSGGACGRGSNAARRAHALYDCITGGGPKPTNRGPNNPLVSLTDPAQTQTPTTGAMACLMNGGDMPRTSVNDPKCAMAQCVQGAVSCPCNKPGSPGGATVLGNMTPRISASTSPNCAEAPCGSVLPRSSGGTIGTDRGPRTGPSPITDGNPRGPAPRPGTTGPLPR